VTDLVGDPRNRIDAPAKVTGDARYSADIALEGMAHAVFAVSTVAAGRIARIDVTEAEQSAGVVAVFTHETMPRLARPPAFEFPNIGTNFAFLQGRPNPVRRTARGHGRRRDARAGRGSRRQGSGRLRR
jgi:CO/xanthine dehydrogenase Mo-binding subunit